MYRVDSLAFWLLEHVVSKRIPADKLIGYAAVIGHFDTYVCGEDEEYEYIYLKRRLKWAHRSSSQHLRPVS
jgi:hypothetical protein